MLSVTSARDFFALKELRIRLISSLSSIEISRKIGLNILLLVLVYDRY